MEPQTSTVTTDRDENTENVDALRKLAVAKNPPAQIIQELLNATRAERKHWLQTQTISVKNILEKYPILQKPKWVSCIIAKLCSYDLAGIKFGAS